MARPAILQRLRHGRLLCRGVFRFFVETWNWLVGYVDNLKGDADLNPRLGHVVVDRADPDAPVIRLVNVGDFFGERGGASASDKPLPYEVRQKTAASGLFGGWRIFLRNRSTLLNWGGSYVDPSGNVSQIDYGDWYTLTTLDSSSSRVWLNLYDAAGLLSAKFDGAKDDKADESVLIATLQYSATAVSGGAGGAKQNVVGELTVGKRTPHPFEVRPRYSGGELVGYRIYLPNMDNLVMWGDEYLDSLGAVAQERDAWYKLTGLSSSPYAVWLNLYEQGEGRNRYRYGTFQDTPDSSAVYRIHIASVSAGAVTQTTVGSIRVCGCNPEGGGGSGTGDSGSWSGSGGGSGSSGGRFDL